MSFSPKNKIRIVTAASLFDGHDASINIMRRIMQANGAEVIHLGHDRSGTVGLTDSTGAVGSEKWRAQVGFNWQYKDFGVFWQTNWYDKAKVDPNGDAIFLYNDVKEYYLSDASIIWQVTPAARVQLIVNNVFDAEPPFNSFSYQYDRIGRRYQAGVNLRF